MARLGSGVVMPAGQTLQLRSVVADGEFVT